MATSVAMNFLRESTKVSFITHCNEFLTAAAGKETLRLIKTWWAAREVPQKLPRLFLYVKCVRIHVLQVHMRMSVYVRLCVCVVCEGQRSSSGVIPQVLCILEQGISLARCLAGWLGWLGLQHQEHICFYLPRAEITRICPNSQLFPGL